MRGVRHERRWGVRSANSFWTENASRFDGFYELRNWWDRVLHGPLQVRHEAAMDVVRLLSAPSVCDVGCGSGRQLVAAIEAGAARAVGVDVSSEMVRLARERSARSDVAGRVVVHATDVLSWDPGEQFDLVWALGVFDYERAPSVLLKKLHALSRDRVLVTFRRVWAFRSPFRKLTYRLRGQPIYLHTLRGIRREFERAGFLDINVERLTAGLYIANARVPSSRARE